MKRLYNVTEESKVTQTVIAGTGKERMDKGTGGDSTHNYRRKGH